MDRQVQTNQYVPLNFFEIWSINFFFFFFGGGGGGGGGGGALELVNFFYIESRTKIFFVVVLSFSVGWGVGGLE